MAKQIAHALPPLSRLIHHRNDLLAERDHLARELRHAQDATANAAALPLVSVLEAYSDADPVPQNAFDIFKGEWLSQVPGFKTGAAGLFADGRVEWLEQQCGGFAGKRILELGPLEGGHTAMMAARGAAGITAIEPNARAFLKCLIVKEALGVNARFLFGDARPFLKTCRERFDFVLASGVLYHTTDPIDLLEGLSRVCDAMGIWTHYYDQDVIAAQPNLRRRFDRAPELKAFRGESISLHRQHYREALEWNGFCGGSAPGSVWMSKEGILAVLNELGFEVTMGADDPDHPNGPCILLFASRGHGARPPGQRSASLRQERAP